MSAVAKGVLPKGWLWTSVEELGETITGTTPATNRPEFYGKALPFFKPTDLDAGYLVTDARQCLSEAGAEQARVLPIGTVLVTCIGATIGKTGLARVRCATNQQINALVPAASLRETKWLFWWFVGPEGQRSIRENSSSTTLPILNKSRFNKLQAAIPPLPEQHRIVEAIESYFTRLDDGVAILERVERNLKRYRASVLKSAVEGRLVPTEAALAKQEGRDYEPASVLLERILAERRRCWAESGGKGKYQEPMPSDATNLPELPEGWCWASIDQVGDVSGGVTKNAKRDDLSASLPYLRVANVYANELRLDDIKQIGLTKQEMERVLLKKNDLLVVEGNGSLDQIGRVALWDGSIDPCVHQNHLIKIRFDDATLSEWTLTWLLSPRGRLAIQQVASSTSGLHTLSISKIARLPVPLCPQPERRRIFDEIARGASLLSAAEQSTSLNRHRCTRLRQSILKWAFEGKLADQDPNDEPASVLLERIKAERDKTQPAKKKSRA